MAYYKKEENLTNFNNWVNPPVILEGLTLKSIEKSETKNGSVFLKITMEKTDNPALQLPWLAEYEQTVDANDDGKSQKRIKDQIDRGVDLLDCFYSVEEYEEYLDKIESFEGYCDIMVFLLAKKISDGTASETSLRGKIVSDSKGWAAWSRWRWIQNQDNQNKLTISDGDRKYAETAIARRRELNTANAAA